MGKIIDSSLSNVWRSHTEMKALEIYKIWHNFKVGGQESKV